MSQNYNSPPTSFKINLMAALIYLGLCHYVYIYLRASAGINIIFLVLISIIPIAIFDLRRTLFLKYQERNEFNIKRITTKCLGLYALYTLWALLYILIPYYSLAIYNETRIYFFSALPYILLFTIPYVIFVDLFLPEPIDSAWHIGNIIFKQERPNYPMVFKVISAWAIKFAFFSILSTALIADTHSIVKTFDSWKNVSKIDAMRFYYIYAFIYIFKIQ